MDVDSLETDQGAVGSPRRPIFVTVIAILVAASAAVALAGGVYLTANSEAAVPDSLWNLLAGVIVAIVLALISYGLWRMKDWARSAISALIALGLLFFLITMVFDLSAQIFGGERVVPVPEILKIMALGLIRVVIVGAIPAGILYGLTKVSPYFKETAQEREFVDGSVRYLLVVAALSAIVIVFLIILFTFSESLLSIRKVGILAMLFGTVWRPGSIIGADNPELGLLPMIVGSVLSTAGAVVLGVPLAVGLAVLLAEVASSSVRELLRPAVELLAGIPSVVYGLFGMVVLAPLIRQIEVPYNTGFNLLNAAIILAVMILPTVASVTEDAIRAVPKNYKEGALALGATHWQAIWQVILPSARSGIVSAIILGIGRALGETMALIMVIGNSIAMPTPLNGNPLTLFLSSARTLTGNIAVEINYAEGIHRSALFFTGVLLFVMILLVNQAARYLMRERLEL